jgi:hypothetical protein
MAGVEHMFNCDGIAACGPLLKCLNHDRCGMSWSRCMLNYRGGYCSTCDYFVFNFQKPYLKNHACLICGLPTTRHPRESQKPVWRCQRNTCRDDWY